MKSIFTLFITIIVFSMAFSQSAITIDADNMPIPYRTFTFDDITAKNPPSPNIGAGELWNYGSYTNNDLFTTTYIEEVDSFYLNFGVDTYVSSFKSLTPQLGYLLYNELDFNDQGVDDIGVFIDEQVYSLQNFTGNAADNITFPFQGYVVNDAPRRVMNFPFTVNSAWSSVSYRVNDFSIKISAFGLNNVPSQHVYYTFRSDSIVGNGKLRVHTPDGPSIAYDVLVDQVLQYNVDSFYVGGAPAPAALTNAFGIRQGQVTDLVRQYNFYRAGTFAYLMRFNYGNDTSYTKIATVLVNTDDLTTETSTTSDVKDGKYATVLFPNPASSSTVNLTIIGKDINSVNYSLTDANGREIRTIKNYSIENNSLIVPLNDINTSGIYFLHVTDSNHKLVTSEKITLIR
jgi:hypothetical protein